MVAESCAHRAISRRFSELLIASHFVFVQMIKMTFTSNRAASALFVFVTRNPHCARISFTKHIIISCDGARLCHSATYIGINAIMIITTIGIDVAAAVDNFSMGSEHKRKNPRNYSFNVNYFAAQICRVLSRLLAVRTHSVQVAVWYKPVH